MNKKQVFLTILDAFSGILSVVSLIGHLVVDAKEVKQIGSGENGDK